MITDDEWRVVKLWKDHVRSGASVPRNVTQRLLDILRREGGSMTRPQLQEAKRQGFDITGIKEA